MSTETTDLKAKLAQALEVIEFLVERTDFKGTEAQRARSYFAGDVFDPDFLPWPRFDDKGKRPEELNAANDD